MVIVFTRPSFSSFFDFTQTGPIGDTIGGITAPFFNLLAAILIFISFRAQVKANSIQFIALKEEREKSRKSEQQQQLTQALSKFEFEFNSIQFSYFLTKLTFNRDGHPEIDRYERQDKGANALNIISSIILEDVRTWENYKSGFTNSVGYLGRSEDTYYDFEWGVLENSLREVTYVYSILATLIENLNNYEFNDRVYYFNQTRAFLASKAVAEMAGLLEALEKANRYEDFAQEYRTQLSSALRFLNINRSI